jgi:hypothetical protein
MAQGNTGKTMIGITGNGCSDCNGCRSGDLRNISSSSGCYTSWVSALTNITTAAGQEFTNASQLTRDPWGSPYCLDENEREGGPTDCRQDSLLSVGPDGIYGTSDDYTTVLPFSSPCP